MTTPRPITSEFAADIAEQIDTTFDDEGDADVIATLAVTMALVLHRRFDLDRRGGVLMKIVKYVIDAFDTLDDEAEQ